MDAQLQQQLAPERGGASESHRRRVEAAEALSERRQKYRGPASSESSSSGGIPREAESDPQKAAPAALLCGARRRALRARAPASASPEQTS
jgi:hypothetical protein